MSTLELLSGPADATSRLGQRECQGVHRAYVRGLLSYDHWVLGRKNLAGIKRSFWATGNDRRTVNRTIPHAVVPAVGQLDFHLAEFCVGVIRRATVTVVRFTDWAGILCGHHAQEQLAIAERGHVIEIVHLRRIIRVAGHQEFVPIRSGLHF